MKIPGSVLCAVLLAGFHYVAAEVKNAGDSQIFRIISTFNEITSCHLKTPAGVTLDFKHGEAHPHGDRYVLEAFDPIMPRCEILLRNLQESDSGEWEQTLTSPTTTVTPAIYQLTVIGTDIQSIEEESEEDVTIPDIQSIEEENEEDDVTWLNVIEFPTRTNQIIDISLPKMEHEEKCTIRSPPGYKIKASDLVKVHDSSRYVSCRITIGPMTESLLGDWAVCGTYTENNEEHDRCQPAKIFWNNVVHPDTTWDTLNQASFDHPVHFGHTLNLVVIGIGNIVSCHVITPNGEDLVIKQDSKYPGIKANTLAHSICDIAIGPIDAFMIEAWTIYGVFRDAMSRLNDVRLPINMFLYDEENPYNQAYNVTVRNPINRVVNLGNTLNVEVNVNAGQVDSCYFKTPLGQIYDLKNYDKFSGASFVTEETRVACQVAIGPITEELLGDWELTGKFSNNGVFTELQQTFYIIEEDPANPIEENRTLTFLNSQNIATTIGGIHRLIIQPDVFIHAESCHIRTPDGFQYKIMEGFNLNGIEVIEDTGVECGVIVHVTSEDVIGEWILIARATRFSEAIERRLPFTIYVEESVEALTTNITITEGHDLVVRLKHPIDQYESCKLIGPFGIECAAAERDPFHVDTCGFIRKNVQPFHSGVWTITYGNRTVYKAEIFVTVNSGNEESGDFMTTVDLLRDRSVNKVVGPENAVYCRLEDPSGYAVYDGFGRCNLTVKKVGLEHRGAWNMHVGVPGRVHTVKYQLTVNVKESEGKAVVTTHVEKQRPLVTATCAVETEAEVIACKFRDPRGNILLAASGVSEDRYSFNNHVVSYSSEVKKHECGIRITDPLNSDLGLWRCAIETSEDTYYGHLALLCPWALSQPEIAATVQQEPLLTSDRVSVSAVEEEPATMSCSVQAAIRYCYFRASNGTTFTITPGMSSPTMEYSGAGFDAGECGITFSGLRAADSGTWSCHVGLVGNHTEQRAQFALSIHERMSVNHYLGHGNSMVVEGIVYLRRSLEYCRFVRIDGFGFTTDSVPSQYSVTGLLSIGECQFTARNPTILDLHPWTVVARIRGQDVEIAKDTMEAILIAPPTTTPEPETNEPGVIYRTSGLTIFLYVFLCVLLLMVLMGAMLGPKKNRNWTYRHASSFRRSFQRKPQLPATPEPTLPPQNYNSNI